MWIATLFKRLIHQLAHIDFELQPLRRVLGHSNDQHVVFPIDPEEYAAAGIERRT